MVYREQGRFTEAEPLLKRALSIREKALGPAHPDVIQSLNNLAGLYHDQGRTAEAEPLLKRAQDLEERTAAQVALWQSYMALGTAAHQKGKYAEAEINFKAGLAIAEEFRPEGQHLASNLNNLATLYDDQGRYAEAQPLVKRALAIVEKALGPEHPHVAQSLNNLALLYQAGGAHTGPPPLMAAGMHPRIGP